MKKRRVLIQIAVLVATVLAFLGYLVYRQAKVDDTGPQITIDDTPLTVSVQDSDEAYLQGISAYDDRDGDVSSLILMESLYGVTKDHRVTVTYAAFDRAGNVTKAQRQIALTDYHAPVFTLTHSLTFPSGDSLDVMDYVGAEDVFDGDIVRRVRATLINNTGSLSDEGIHDVHLRVTNSLGDSSELVLPVEIYAPDKYNATLELDAYLLYLPKGTSFHAGSHVKTLSYGGETMDLAESVEGLEITISSAVDIQTPGVYPVTYTVQYSTNNTTYTAYSKLFVIVEE